MDTMFENFDLWMDDALENNRPFVIACKDRENTSEERWVLASLSNEEAKRVYEYLGRHLNTASKK